MEHQKNAGKQWHYRTQWKQLRTMTFWKPWKTMKSVTWAVHGILHSPLSTNAPKIVAKKAHSSMHIGIGKTQAGTPGIAHRDLSLENFQVYLRWWTSSYRRCPSCLLADTGVRRISVDVHGSHKTQSLEVTAWNRFHVVFFKNRNVLSWCSLLCFQFVS